MTYLDRLAAALDAAGIAYERNTDERNTDAFVSVCDGADLVWWNEQGESFVDYVGERRETDDAARAIAIAAEVWREMQGGGEG